MALLVQDKLDYASRLEHLRRRKEAQTQEKLQRLGYMNEDDYGMVLPPEDFQWEPKPNHPNGSFYGLEGLGRQFLRPDGAIARLRRSHGRVSRPVHGPFESLAGVQLAAGIRLLRAQARPGALRDHLGNRQRRAFRTRLPGSAWSSAGVACWPRSATVAPSTERRRQSSFARKSA